MCCTGERVWMYIWFSTKLPLFLGLGIEPIPIWTHACIKRFELTKCQRCSSVVCVLVCEWVYVCMVCVCVYVCMVCVCVYVCMVCVCMCLWVCVGSVVVCVCAWSWSKICLRFTVYIKCKNASLVQQSSVHFTFYILLYINVHSCIILKNNKKQKSK